MEPDFEALADGDAVRIHTGFPRGPNPPEIITSPVISRFFNKAIYGSDTKSK